MSLLCILCAVTLNACFSRPPDTLISSNEPRGRGSHRDASAENDEPYVPQIFLQCARTYASSTASAALVLRSVCERWPPRLTTPSRSRGGRAWRARPSERRCGSVEELVVGGEEARGACARRAAPCAIRASKAEVLPRNSSAVACEATLRIVDRSVPRACIPTLRCAAFECAFTSATGARHRPTHARPSPTPSRPRQRVEHVARDRRDGEGVRRRPAARHGGEGAVERALGRDRGGGEGGAAERVLVSREKSYTCTVRILHDTQINFLVRRPKGLGQARAVDLRSLGVVAVRKMLARAATRGLAARSLALPARACACRALSSARAAATATAAAVAANRRRRSRRTSAGRKRI